jgi:hypothetical protein
MVAFILFFYLHISFWFYSSLLGARQQVDDPGLAGEPTPVLLTLNDKQMDHVWPNSCLT